jgi:O-antigen ligase
VLFSPSEIYESCVLNFKKARLKNFILSLMKSFFEKFDFFFPVRAESQNNSLAIWLDRAIYSFILLTALAAPISIAVTNVGWVMGIVLWVFRLFVRPRPKFWKTPLDTAFFGFFAWCLLSSFFSYAPDLSLDRQRVLTLFPIFYLLVQNLRYQRSVKFLAAALIFSTMVTVFWTFTERGIGRGVQVFGLHEDSPLARAGISNGDTLLKINGNKIWQPNEIISAIAEGEMLKVNFYRLDYPVEIEMPRARLLDGATAEEQLGFEHWQRGRSWRSQGFYNHYTTYAEALQLIMSLVLGLTLASLNKHKWLKIILLVCLLGMGAALLLTATRASQIGFFVSALIIIAIGSSRKTFLASIALLLPLIIGAAVYLDNTRNVGFIDSSDNSTTWRLTVWHEGVELLTKSPRHLLVGVGIDSVKRFKCAWGLFNNCTLPAGHFHSTPLQIAVECGLPALLLWLLIVWRYGKSLYQATRDVNHFDQIEKGILLGALGGLAGFLASGLAHYNLGDSEVAMIFYFIMGLSFALILMHQRGSVKALEI